MREITITIKRKEVYYDIKHGTWRRSRSSGKGEFETKDLDLTMGDADPWFNRCMDSAINAIKSKFEWIVSDASSSSDEITSDTATYDIVVSVCDNWSSNASVLKSLIHEYIKDYCLSDWYSNIDSNVQSQFSAMAAEYLDRIGNEAFRTKAPSK